MSKEKNNKSKVNQKNPNFKIMVYIELISAVLSTLFCINFSADISLLAFPVALVFTGITVYFAYFCMIRKEDGNKCFTVLKLVQYLPFVHLLTFILRRAGNHGTPFWVDLITVILWIVMFVDSFIVARKLNDKRVKITTSGWKIPKEGYTKPRGGLRILYEIVDWIDALVQAVFTVLVFQIFVIQLYEIPSESMVPTFLIKDRVLVTKFDCGPKFPLTDVGLPDFRKYKKGDTVVLRNPHYSMDRKSEVKSVTSQLVYMLSFMTVKMNKDEYGQQKADPLVKRIAAVPGEQMVMQDGVLYTRTKNSNEFKKSDMDEKYATWNLNTISPEAKAKVQTFPLGRDNLAYDTMIEIEKMRSNYDLNAAAFIVQENIESLRKLINPELFTGSFEEKEYSISEIVDKKEQIIADILTKDGGFEWFENFVTSWINNSDNERDMYEESNYRLNVMAKVSFANQVVLYSKALLSGESISELKNSESFEKEEQLSEYLKWYIQGLLDQRNMPVFPANDEKGNPQYLPSDCYFMMGDNRFNSLDLRHSYDSKIIALTKDDAKSLVYKSYMEPQYINKKYIVGKAVFRFWPANRISRVR